jgi:hypothetical protein
MGRRTKGRVQGRIAKDEWVAVSVGDQADLIRAIAPLAKARGGETVTFASAADLAAYWSKERAKGLRALCLLGTGVPWLAQERLQLDGALVSRIPVDDANALDAYATRLVRFEAGRPSLPRLAVLVAPAFDEFTRILHEVFVAPLTQVLSHLNFEVVLHPPAERTAGRLAEAGLIVLLTHGGDGGDAGEPVGLDDGARQAVVDACSQGAWVAHLGCNGAGTFAGGRFGKLIEQLGLDAPITPCDSVSRFAIDCVRAGARGVLAHVDSTWSNAFERADSIVTWVEWIASGEGALAWSAEDLARDAGRAAVDAFEARAAGDPEAGLHWLRHLDLRGFVTFGDPSSFCGWT